MSTEMLQGFALSPQQKHIWRLQSRDGAAAYRSRYVFTVTGELEPEILTPALRKVVERYEVLRTRFRLLPGMAHPLQVISADADFAYVFENLSALPADEQAMKRETFPSASEGEDESESDVVLSVRHLMLDPEQHLLAIEAPVMNADAISLHLLARRISIAYVSILNEETMAEPAVQYVDVSETMNDCLQTDDFDIGRQYWREQIADLGHSHIRQRLVASDFRHKVFRIQGADRLWERAEEFCIRLGVSLESLVLASWGLVVSRMESAEETLIGVCCDGRAEDVLLEVIGLLSRPVPFLFRPTPSETFTEVVLEVHRQLTEMTEEQLYFDPAMVNEGSSDEGNYKTCFEYVRTQPHDVEARQTFVLESLLSVTDRFEMKLTSIEVSGRLLCQLEYDEARITESEIRRVWDSLSTLIDSGLSDPGRPVESLEILSPEAKTQLVKYARGEKIDWEMESVHGMFEAQAVERPDGVALVYEGEHLSYEEVNRKGNQLANYLRRRGVEVEDRIALYLERGLELMIAVLGVLKSGGAYVPMDPGYPMGRLKYIVEEAGAAVVLTIEPLAGGLLSNGAEEICLDKEWAKIGEERDSSSEVRVTGDNLAYAIYTSGSTGRPKGVMIPHGPVCNHMRWMQKIYPIGSDDRMLQKTAIGFDAAGTEIWLPWLAGGTVVVAREGGQRDVEYLGRVILEESVTIFQGVPTLLREMLVNGSGLVGDGPLRLVYSGGELLTVELAEKLMKTTGSELCNLYGPTEATIDATGWQVRSSDSIDRVPIGRPITNTRVCVLDKKMELAPIGVIGEIYIGGAAVGRGYLNRADLTAERYLPGVLGEYGERLYRTGDRGRMADGGDLDYLGRIDAQVKLRGYRIELGEIEAVMARHEGVRQCAVVDRDDERGERQLVGYVVPTGTDGFSIAELRSFVGEQLPDYMAPAAIVELEAMPLTSNGKLDRKALPAPDLSARRESFVAPRSAVEEILCDIWADVLRAKTVGINDNFFELGGHSLLAMQVMSRIRDLLGVEVPLRSLFSDPTPAAIAVAVEQERMAGEKISAPPLVRVERNQELPLSFAQQRLWLIDQLHPGNTAYNISYAVRLNGNLDVGALRKSFNEIVARHEVLRTSFPVRDGEPRLSISSVADVQLNCLDFSTAEISEQPHLIRQAVKQEAKRGFDLSRGPLVRAQLIKASEDEHVLVVGMHHIVSDGWSMGVIIREFSQLYESFSQEQESPLAELEIQYADYATWQRSWLQGDALNSQLEYWKKQLDGVAVLEMPADRRRPAVAGYRGAGETFRLSLELADKLRQMSRREGVTLFMTLLAAFQVVLSRHSGQRDIAVGTPIAGRNQREIEGLIGLFVNTLVMRADLSANPTVKELLTKVRETALGAYMHQDLPFDKLVEELRPERSLSHQPLFQVMFMLQNVQQGTRSIGGINLKGEPLELDTAKFELELSVVDTGETIYGGLEYATELYDGWRVRRLLDHLERVLEGMVGDETERVMDLPLMSEAEWQEVVVEWNQTAAEYPRDQRVHEIIEAQVERTPDAIAAVDEEGHVTYNELNHRANHVGHYLRRSGVAPESVVAVGANRGLGFLISMLGVFKSGGTYLPLNLGLPAKRLQHSLAESNARLVLTTRESAVLLDSATGFSEAQVPVVSVEDIQECAEYQIENLASDAHSNNLAYVIYTSGSTGLPKGAMVEHDGMLNHLFAKMRDLNFTARDVIAQTASQAFDISVWQFLISLLAGGRVVIVNDENAHDPVRLMKLVQEQRVTVAEVVPSLLPALLAERAVNDTKSSASALRWLLVTGEAFPSELCRRWLNSFPDIQVMNAYGPTECSDDVTHHSVASCAEYTANVPLGRAVANTRIYVLDEMFKPVPIGVSGEICVGGVGVGRGYVADPEKSAKGYIPDPFSEAGSRLYRTGDVGRYNIGGVIEYLGRIDQQVKIRGYRIELGEVETALHEYPMIEQAAVVAVQREGAEKRLVAYVVVKEELNRSELREYLKEKLPDYMAPAVIMQLDELPLTANGKLDRKALPMPEVRTDVEYAAPQTEVEEILCGIWAEVLVVERVGIHDNFFDLGGSSLSAFRVISRIRRAMGIEAPLLSLFETGTISEFAKRIEGSRKQVPQRRITRVDRNAFRSG